MSAALSSVVAEGTHLGRHFRLVSLLSSTVLVVFTVATVSSGAFVGTPSISALTSSITDASVGDAAIVALGAVLVGVVLHPLQFAVVQLLEGYWGSHRWAVRAMSAAAGSHRRNITSARLAGRRASVLLGYLATLEDEEAQPRTQLSAGELARLRQSLAFLPQEGDRLASKFPVDDHRLMPTLLGNRLRRGEDFAGTAWGLASIVAAPHISLVAAERDEQYLEDARTELDMAVRFCLVWGLATAVATVAFWRHGPWLLVALATYALAYLSYRGAVVAAEEHGVALATMIDLNRFAFYDRLGVPRPKDVDEERKQNETLKRLLNGSSEATLPYAEPTRSDDS